MSQRRLHQLKHSVGVHRLLSYWYRCLNEEHMLTLMLTSLQIKLKTVWHLLYCKESFPQTLPVNTTRVSLHSFGLRYTVYWLWPRLTNTLELDSFFHPATNTTLEITKLYSLTSERKFTDPHKLSQMANSMVLSYTTLVLKNTFYIFHLTGTLATTLQFSKHDSWKSVYRQ